MFYCFVSSVYSPHKGCHLESSLQRAKDLARNVLGSATHPTAVPLVSTAAGNQNSPTTPTAGSSIGSTPSYAQNQCAPDHRSAGDNRCAAQNSKLSGLARLFSPTRNYRIAGKIPAPDADPPPDSHRGPRGRDRGWTAPIRSATTHRAVSWDRGALPFQIPGSPRSPLEALADARENKSTPAHPPPRSRTGQKPLSGGVASRHRGGAPVPERPLCRRHRHRRRCRYCLRSLPDQYPSDPDARTAG